MPALQILISALLAVLVLAGISMMSKVRTAVAGNLLNRVFPALQQVLDGLALAVAEGDGRRAV